MFERLRRFRRQRAKTLCCTAGCISEVIAAVQSQGLEGLVAKNLDSVYERGRRRSGAWRKMRLDKGQEFVTGGYTPGAKYFDAVIFGYYADGKLLLYAGRPVTVSPPCCARKSRNTSAAFR